MITQTSIVALIQSELETDKVHDDVTAQLLDEKYYLPVKAVIKAREKGVFSGTAFCEEFQKAIGKDAFVTCLVEEGEAFEKGKTLVRMEGKFGVVLGLERTLLNFLSHLCGVATQTSRFVEAVTPHPAKILATRKTLPGLRELQLRAVVAGGGYIHRRSLSDGILIKENHQEVVPDVVLLERAAQSRSPLHGVEIEVQHLKQLDRILQTPPTVIMLDNLSVDQMREAIQKIRSSCFSKIEASGGVTLQTVRAIAELGVDFISVGALTHSVTAVNLSLDVEKGPMA